jgi:hypothetical protein
MSNTPESLAFVTLEGASAACDVLERILDTHVATPDRAKVQQVIDALFAITNDTDAIVIRPSSDPHQPGVNGMGEVRKGASVECNGLTVSVDGITPPYIEAIADREGWFISYAAGNSDGTAWRLERRDEGAVFESDKEAHRHVIAKAAEGSKYHADCLAFLRSHEPVEYDIVMGAVAQFNHAYSFAFEVLSHNEDGEDVTPDMLRAALLARIQKLSDEDLAQACDAPWDTMPAESVEGALS